jgi:NADPH-dependent 2,4-dienoyl-CoA reductase/sulfur reductase-like enzyme/pSer/pThr/pTyr-binding forkhead associated (FHA) protein
MTTQQAYVIIGNGIAGATAAEVIRAEDRAAEITVVAEEPTPVFYRPALKDYLGGKIREEKLWARPISFYPDRHIRFVTDRVMAIQPGEHTLALRSGATLAYSRLLLAHGARATSLTCPGVDLVGVTTLRTVADYQRVLARLNNARRIVVVGSGTLALESIETLRHRGYEVTHLLRRRTLWSEVLDLVASDLVLQQERREGVDVRTEQEIAEVCGQNGQVTGVITTTGQHIPCEIVLLGIGIEPSIDFVKSAGIACGRGVKVDGAMRTNVPDIYAAGDLIETADPITGKARVIGQWYPSVQQARAAAYSMLDLLDTEHLFRFGNFYNATFLYGLDFASVGISTVPRGEKNYQELVADPQPRHYQKVILKQGVPVGMVALGDRRSVLTYKRAIDHSVNLSPVASRLFAPDFHLGAWLDTQGVPPPLLGVNREGAVAVQRMAYATRVVPEVKSATGKPGTAPTLREARLVPVSQLELSPPLADAYLSQTRVVTIGRLEGSSLVINHNTISRRHAEISYANGQYVLRDLGSKNGTQVNGQRVAPNSLTVLAPESQVQFGSVKFVLKLQAVDPAESVLLNKEQKQAFFNATRGSAANIPTFSSAIAGAGEQTVIHAPAPALSQGQPVLASDGSLSLPGVATPLSANLVAPLRQGPALVCILNGQPLVFALPLERQVTIGREQGNDIVLQEMSISRKHAAIFPGPDGLDNLDSLYIRDLQSGNGVRVNHHKITSAYRLTHEAAIELGNVRAYFLNYQQPRSPLPVRGGGKGIPVMQAVAVPGSEPVRAGTATKMAHCRQCGASLVSHQARFCPSCGSPQ